MFSNCRFLMILALFALAWPTLASAEEAEPHPMAFMFGEWVGDASGQSREGHFKVTQTERVGPLLNGDIVAIEGRGYADTGETLFNAFAVVSSTGVDGAWEMRSYANGRAGTFPFELTDTGYIWSLPAGPNARMVYTSTFDGDIWQQIGEYTPDTGPKRQTFEMTLTRISDTDWPMRGPVLPAMVK